MDKPKRKWLDWSNATYDNCGCGQFRKLIDGSCAECYEDAYNSEVEDFYITTIKELKEKNIEKTNIKNYKVVTAPTQKALENKVCALLLEGWSLLGSASFSTRTHTFESYHLGNVEKKVDYSDMYLQTMVLHGI